MNLEADRTNLAAGGPMLPTPEPAHTPVVPGRSGREDKPKREMCQFHKGTDRASCGFYPGQEHGYTPDNQQADTIPIGGTQISRTLLTDRIPQILTTAGLVGKPEQVARATRMLLNLLSDRED